MATVRKMPAADRTELDEHVSTINDIIADLESFALLDAHVIGRDQLTATVADLTELRTKLAAGIVDLGVLRTPIVAALVDMAAVKLRYENGVVGNAQIADGTTDGKIKTVAAVDYLVKGQAYSKAITNDLWDLTAEVDTDGTHYRAYWLYLDASGTATIAAGTDAITSEALAIAALPAVTATKSVIGVYVAGPSTDFNGAAGLDSFGTFYNGWPSTYTPTASAPAALTASAPAALTTTTTTGITDGTTDGYLQAASDIAFEIAQVAYRKAATDNLWNLSAQTDTIAARYRAYWLYLSTAGAASIVAQSGADSTSAALAIAALPATDATKCPVAIYVAGPLCDFNGAAGLAAQGTIYDGYLPRVSPETFTAEAITLIDP